MKSNRPCCCKREKKFQGRLLPPFPAPSSCSPCGACGPLGGGAPVPPAHLPWSENRRRGALAQQEAQPLEEAILPGVPQEGLRKVRISRSKPHHEFSYQKQCLKPRHYRDYHDEYYATGVPVVHHYDSAAVVRAAPAVQVAPRRRNHYAAKKAGKDFKNIFNTFKLNFFSSCAPPSPSLPPPD